MVIKSLNEAVRNEDTIRAVVRSIASNQDGQIEDRAQPNRRSQIDLIKDTYSTAGLGFDDTRYFEANGRGRISSVIFVELHQGHCSVTLSRAEQLGQFSGAIAHSGIHYTCEFRCTVNMIRLIEAAAR